MHKLHDLFNELYRNRPDPYAATEKGLFFDYLKQYVLNELTEEERQALNTLMIKKGYGEEFELFTAGLKQNIDAFFKNKSQQADASTDFALDSASAGLDPETFRPDLWDVTQPEDKDGFGFFRYF